MDYRRECGRCRAPLADEESAYFCSRECTFCPRCYRQLRFVCPNCSGELVRRPRTGPSVPAPRSLARAPPDSVSVRRAGPGDLAAVAPLFDAYRQFYEQPSDIGASTRFLSERLARDESVVFVAEEGQRAVGFVQMYPLFTSVSLGRVYVLNDLFVAPGARRHGVGAALLAYARRWAEAEKTHYLTLTTAVDNPAQRLYEAWAWQLDREFLYYELLLSPGLARPEPGEAGDPATSGGGEPDRPGSSRAPG